ncbi:pyruvate flavodoxin/ferredoxin oxidoreductase domain protein [Magnetococcus marinus MC-1]|uniref:Pyruvate flavodoxin/ferredoxin oxidoreductase domain protein n=1 Tax=Magnetococcus marinus (strain ATCC BAA-1437 / JCM 17883 / MC-1) TaxID=156889 RepID=A0L8G4_MAGMM|nr:2-oxoacid:acceptor oxidoreductase subunit alpha [Magnetococcus marinus]6N2N_A Chain A, Pyruvate flavodoxin/ferredoxin oxidoreductase domain protein [Magnetococcus marinus MC-1]6N2N_C Chain C, Pyruvate flavodoxin/ferredoxin oxidoreductase domain protein [Magnetococcus marinus MC-1]6N2O_A Chain A, Pyruvate flavodoxin/ferredoxin oxidoreductase domain protein [Magnetococcus marinus MC-1]6N2O_C Chain C, Pyruvate flavodoxin/ferredoxin oxidoreductase domain protein [Magnetococcus marinus MC-1]ABK4
MEKKDLIIRVAGEGGEGIISSGDFIAAACARAGLEVYTFKTFPAEIKGGYAMYQVRASSEKLYCQGDTFDVFCAFNGEAYEQNKDKIKPGTAFVYDYPGGDFEPDEIPEGVFAYPIPMSQTAKEMKSYRSKNMVALGALSELFNISENTLKEVLSDKFGKKGEEVLAFNLEAFDKGKALAKALTKADPFRVADPQEPKDVIIMAGNDAVGLGGILGGLEFFSAYPITPATEVAKYVATHLPKCGGDLVQAEDEIASIAQVLGASYAGKKSMTATSGPGLALMSEMLGMAHMSETPCLVVDVQRGGPSTGLPTKHEQSDLFLAIHGGHGDSPRIVLSVEDVKDCISMTVDGLNLAEKYQAPVIVLSDGSLAFSTQTIPRPKPEDFTIINRKTWDGQGTYKRYELTEDNISPMAAPGTPNAKHIATGLEHGETGAPNYSPANHELMHRKRFNKQNSVLDFYKNMEVEGVEGEADVGIITWGSTIGVVREAMQRLTAEGLKVKAMYPKLLWPMPVADYDAFGATCKKVIVPEVNFQGQLSHFIRAETSIKPIPYTICGGLPFTPEMIVNRVKEEIQ